MLYKVSHDNLIFCECVWLVLKVNELNMVKSGHVHSSDF